MVGLTVAKREDLVAAAQAAGLLRGESPASGGSQSGQTQVVVDTSAIIDGRIADIVDSGFLYHKLVIPHFVLEELQRIADSSDAQRRGRGRRGLEILARLQKEGPTPVEIVTDDPVEAGDVDSKLVAMARARGAAILTNDFNLNRVADLQSIRVLNINSLANALKPALLPGDTLRIKDHHRGQGAGPGGRLPGRRHDGRGRRRRSLRRHGARRRGHARSPDGHGPDGLRADAPGVSARRSPQAGTADPIEAVIVAAGASRRMGGVDKLDAELEGRSILRWSIEALAAAGVERIVIVTSPARIPEIAAADWLPDSVVAVVAGGERRQESVAAGVAALAEAAEEMRRGRPGGRDRRARPGRRPARPTR